MIRVVHPGSRIRMLTFSHPYRYPDLGLISDIYKELQAKHKQFSTDAVGDDKYRSGQRESHPLKGQ
jgi:hypothetical protein